MDSQPKSHCCPDRYFSDAKVATCVDLETRVQVIIYLQYLSVLEDLIYPLFNGQFITGWANSALAIGKEKTRFEETKEEAFLKSSTRLVRHSILYYFATVLINLLHKQQELPVLC